MVLTTIKLFPAGTPGLVYCITRHVQAEQLVEVIGCVFCLTYVWYINMLSYVIITSMAFVAYTVMIRIYSLIPGRILSSRYQRVH